ncbi:hypothetical protein [Olivibacter ginsenosidimutans]
MMKKFYVRMLYYVLVLLTYSSCEKPIPELPSESAADELQPVTFKLSGFSSTTKPLDLSASTILSKKEASLANLASLQGISPSASEQYLYFWSFNDENLIPDLAVYTDLATLTFTATNTEPAFTTGYGLSPYPAGKCLSLKGAKTILIKMPLADVEQLTTFAFDAGSSDTGPKNFKLSYSTDNGEHFTSLSDDNPMPIDRNRYSFDLSMINSNFYTADFLIKIEPFEGDRGDGKPYNEATGTVKIDNVRLSGIYNTPSTGNPQGISDLHYYIFNAEDHLLAAQGITPFDASNTNSELTIKLPPGSYYANLFSNVSSKELLLPSTVEQASSLYLANAFENAQALIFGANIPTFQVEHPMESEVILKRYFSQIKFEFTDKDDLSFIHKLIIKPLHTSFVYRPFGSDPTSPIVDESVITLFPTFQTNDNSIAFNQFMGDLSEPVTISYTVQVYDAADELIRTFDVSSAIKNNIQLTFTGDLLSGVDKPSAFQVNWNEEWDGSLNTPF